MEETDQKPLEESNQAPAEDAKPSENDPPAASESKEDKPSNDIQNNEEASVAPETTEESDNQADTQQAANEEKPEQAAKNEETGEAQSSPAPTNEAGKTETNQETESPTKDADSPKTDDSLNQTVNVEPEKEEQAEKQDTPPQVIETSPNVESHVEDKSNDPPVSEILPTEGQPPTVLEHEEKPNTNEEGAAAPALSLQQQETEQPKNEADLSPTTVKFQILPSYEVITVTSTLGTNIASLKDVAAAQLRLPPSEILIRRNGEELNIENSLLDLGVAPNSTVQFEILAAKEEVSLKSVTPFKDNDSADFITVRVQKENNEFTDIVVQIERQYTRKAFLGGYRHKLSGSEYHHASAQTQQKAPKVSTVERFNRDCQTVFEKNRSQQTTNVTSTQMPKTGCYISTEEDKIITAKKYITYDEYMKKRIKAVIVLQSYLRRWQARNTVNELRDDRDRRIEWERQEEIRKRREKEERIKTEFEKRINPKTREDFDLLYSALEKWRMEELGQINDEFTGPERKAALCALLEQETQLIGSIDRRKIDAYKEGKEKKIMQFLNKAAAPKKWRAYDGRFTEMDTQYTIRAKELRDIYNSINMKYLTQDERLDVLLTLKHTVKEHDCKLTREITELIDREADLLMRGMRDSNLEGLRKRIATLFLQYCKSPLFNPEAARLLKVPEDPSTLVKDIYFCPSSNQYLPSTEFKLTSKSRVVGKCRKALQLDNEARTRQDYSHYRVMMRSLRRSEENYHDNSKIAYLIQEKDLQYLIENIWAAQSILSSWDDLYDLILVRWNKDEEWSPWNTILLTKDEAMAHLKLDHLDDAYSKQFISKIAHKHTLARVHFAKLPGMAEALRKKTTGSKRMPGVGAVEGVSAY